MSCFATVLYNNRYFVFELRIRLPFLPFVFREVVIIMNHKLSKEERLIILKFWWKHKKKTESMKADSEDKFLGVQPRHSNADLTFERCN